MNKYLKLNNYRVKLKNIFEKKYTISFSQSGEDIILQNLFNILKIEKPSYLDIGAFHPKNLNNTFVFYKKGSRGINIEPNSKMWELFEKYRNGDKNLNVGIGQKKGELDYYMIDAPTLNTFSKLEAMDYAKSGYKIIDVKKIRVTTITEVLEENFNGKFPDLLSLDTEGLDMEILKSVDWQKSSPKVICVETIKFSNEGKGQKNLDLMEFLRNIGYEVFADTYINTIFVKRNAI